MTMGRAEAQTYRVLYSFAGPPTDGANATASLLLGSGGTLFGTTQFGGAGDCALGCGVVFKLGKKGKETILHTFDGSAADGNIPQFGLLRESAGNMYGTSAGGGDNNVGTVYEINAAGKETVLYKFTGNPASDGGGPAGVLALDKAGNLYGTTVIGGGIGHQGTVFKVDSAGTETVLYSFTGGIDGSAPYAGVIRDAAGNLYGTTYAGGAFNQGTVFKLSPSGKEKVLYSFTGGADGSLPRSGLIRDSAKNLYGTTSSGGATGGNVFKLDKNGKLTVLYSFLGAADGSYPKGSLVRDAAGNLYGVTYFGGAAGCGFTCGVVFKVDPNGKETVLHTFAGSPTDGGLPAAGLIRDAKGNLYGTTSSGGTSGNGIVFKLTP
jgi:uncharacterized repeat protein (TIGR03803 family)